MFLNLVEEEARMNQIFYVGNEMAVKWNDDQSTGQAAARIQERYESKDQMEESWTLSEYYIVHFSLISVSILLVKLGRY